MTPTPPDLDATDEDSDSTPADRWFRMLSDAERPNVLKTQIAEREATRRKRIEEAQQSLRNATDNASFVRALGMGVLAILALGSTCVGYRGVDAWQHIQTEKNAMPLAIARLSAAPPPPAPAASASVTPGQMMPGRVLGP